MKTVYISIAGIVLWVSVIVGMVWHEMHNKDLCHDAGGAYVSGECVRLERIAQ